jgi:hypothetical protein
MMAGRWFSAPGAVEQFDDRTVVTAGPAPAG